MSNRKSKGKGFLLIIILGFGLFAFLLIIGIGLSVPTRTREIYGPSSPALPAWKNYVQAIILIVSDDKLKETGNELGSDLIFPIEQGDSLPQIMTGLTQLGLVRHPYAFRAYLIYTGIDRQIKPGDYLFSTRMSELEIADGLGNPALLKTIISVLAGWRVEEIAATLPDLGLAISSDEFITTVKTNKREGFLFPGSYTVDRDIPAETLMDLFYQGFISNISPELEQNIDNQGRTIQEAVILASIIEREAILDEEMPLIASVFNNRLKIDMYLAADPTVQYSLGFIEDQNTWWKNPLFLDDLEITSPYNTYENPGLPPGPISNPGIAALQAVASPADTPYLYFRAACDGSGKHLFAESFEEHLNNACPE